MLKRLEIVDLIKKALGDNQLLKIKIPRVLRFFGKKFTFGTKLTIIVTNFNTEAMPDQGYGFARYPYVGPCYAVIFTEIGVIEDVVLFGMVNQRLTKEAIDDSYDEIIQHLQEFKEFIDGPGKIEKLEL
jgi:hypothetical protein